MAKRKQAAPVEPQRIERLTPEQQALLPALRDKWVGIGLSTAPADRPRAEAAVAAAFAEVGKKPPRTLVWTTSPMAAALTIGVLRTLNVASVRASVSDSVRASVLASVRDSVRASVRDSVRASVSDSVSDSVSASVLDSVSASVRDLLDVWRYYDFGQWACYWLSFYDVMETLGVAACKRVHPQAELAQASGWNVLFAEIGFMGERPRELHLDDLGQMHCETGPAISYPDGWGVFAIHGVRVPSYVIETPAEITVARIDAETNAEVRRIMIERFVGGVGAYLQSVGARVIDVDHVKVTAAGSRTIPRALMRDGKGQHYLVGTDGSTERVYYMPTGEARTCREAHEAISGLDESKCVAQS